VSSTTCGKQGGSELTSACGKTNVCNGKEGSPWVVGGLSTGATEKGQWALTQFAKPGEQTVVPLSFNVPLKEALASEMTHFIGEEEGEGQAKEATAVKNGECKGTITNPQAASGNLCIFALVQVNTHFNNIVNLEGGSAGAGLSGASLLFNGVTEEGEIIAEGVWAVTG
jgi:hypothetical protein